MLNFDSYGNVSLNPNIINEASINSEINKNNINSNNNNSSLNNNLKHQKDFKKRIKSANPKFKINFKENKNKNSHSTNKNGTIDLPKTRNEMLPDIYDISGTQNEDGPKITKVMRKTYKNQE